MQFGSIEGCIDNHDADETTTDLSQGPVCLPDEAAQDPEYTQMLAAFEKKDIQGGLKHADNLRRKFGKRPNTRTPTGGGRRPTTQPQRPQQPGTASDRSPGHCHYCGKAGHKINQCWKKDEDVKMGIHRKSLNELGTETREDQGAEKDGEPT